MLRIFKYSRSCKTGQIILLLNQKRSQLLETTNLNPAHHNCSSKIIHGYFLLYSILSPQLTNWGWLVQHSTAQRKEGSRAAVSKKADTPHPRAKEKPKQGGRRSKITFRTKPNTHQRCSGGSNKLCVHQDPEMSQRLRQTCLSASSWGTSPSGLPQRQGLWCRRLGMA